MQFSKSCDCSRIDENQVERNVDSDIIEYQEKTVTVIADLFGYKANDSMQRSSNIYVCNT